MMLSQLIFFTKTSLSFTRLITTVKQAQCQGARRARPNPIFLHNNTGGSLLIGYNQTTRGRALQSRFCKEIGQDSLDWQRRSLLKLNFRSQPYLRFPAIIMRRKEISITKERRQRWRGLMRQDELIAA